MNPYMVGKLAPNSSHLTRGLVKYASGRGYFRTVPSQNGNKRFTSPPFTQSLTGLRCNTVVHISCKPETFVCT